MSKIKVFLNKLLYGVPEPEICQNPTVRRRMHWHTMTLYDKDKNTITGKLIGKYELPKKS